MQGSDECPRCGSANVATLIFKGELIAGCRADGCRTLWEPFAESDLLDEDDRYSSFKTMCDNCAFRPGSPEREDKEQWKALIETLVLNETPFMCHKGLPLSKEEGQAHEHPTTPDGKPNITRERFCRGYLDFWRKLQDKPAAALRIIR